MCLEVVIPFLGRRTCSSEPRKFAANKEQGITADLGKLEVIQNGDDGDDEVSPAATSCISANLKQHQSMSRPLASPSSSMMASSGTSLPPNVHVSAHPCIHAKLGQLRSASTHPKDFKSTIHEVALLVASEAFAKVFRSAQDGTVRPSD